MLLSQVVNAVVLGGIYLLFSAGLTLSWGVLDILNLAHGSIFMFGAFSAYVLIRDSGMVLALPVLALFAAAVGALLSAVLQLLVFGPLRRRADSRGQAELGVLIASIGASLIPVAVALNLADAEVVNLPGDVARTAVHTLGPIRITTLQIGIVVLAVLLAGALAWWIARTRSGRALRTIAFDPPTADLLGIPVERLSLLTMAISGALAGGGGLLLAANANAIEPHMGDGLLLKAFAVIVLGGVGSIAGAAVGAFVLAFAETFAVAYVSGDARDIIAFALILLVLVLRPEGLVSRTAWQRA
ncbi:branched-chain amino acid ABC transporter permease [Actinomadura rugatobispora]|uniref:Branched-chain amino acid ABC transporter permease n=1 Tax=Actinomadura rugatobispora TaxID=1994 RepID=A0ABW1A5F2_9ACTN|nr:branched-chain amino acid ABC transporter permease [Actinomadura rugatobispora]